jgi:TM2 domain-containing membrane protein YozV
MAMIFCSGCGKEIHETAASCPHCGAIQPSTKTVVSSRAGKSKSTAGILAIFLGGLGIHRFYLGQWWGIFYLMFCWTGVPSVIGFIEGIVFLSSSDQEWNAQYGAI